MDPKLAPSDAPVCCSSAKTGTGKEIVARHLHQCSERRDGPFLAVSCGEFSATAVERERFGYEARVVAVADARAGFFEASQREDDGRLVFAASSRPSRATASP